MQTHTGTMLVIVIPFLVLVSLCQGFPEQVPNTAAIINDPPVEKWASLLKVHEAKTASLLRDQKAKTASLLRELDNKWASVLRDQQAEMASSAADSVNLKRVLHQQEQKLSDQEVLLRQQGHTLSRQDKLLRQQVKTLLDHEDAIRQQEHTLSHQERLLQEQGARLSYQEGLLQQQSRTREQPKDRSYQSQFSPDENLRHGTNVSQPKTGLTGKIDGSTSHDVMPRSDDTGPWEAVMSHISQQVTEMGADLQALKTQTVNDINAIKTQSTNDINAFKTHTNADIQALQNSNTQQDLAIQDAQSSTFVHWGSSTCSDLSHTVYSGVVGGSWFAHSGAATNHLCMTLSPVFSDHTVPAKVALLYGVEYATMDSHQDKDAVCAVCRPKMSTTVMIPGTNVCTPGWHLQYSGFILAGTYDLTAGSEYICVDSNMENTMHGDADEDGARMYYTVARCGSLPCTPYINNKVVTCAVCSK